MINNDLVHIQLFTVYKPLECDLSLTIFCMENKEGIGDYCRVEGRLWDVPVGA